MDDKVDLRLRAKKVSDSSRITHGKEYAVYRCYNNYMKKHGYYITDDNGRRMSPSYKNETYWQIIEKDVESDYEEHNKTATKIIEEIKMLTIETVTLINGKKAKDLTDDNLFELIKAEEGYIASIGTFKTKFGAAKRRKDFHAKNIAGLVEILDSRFEAEDADNG